LPGQFETHIRDIPSQPFAKHKARRDIARHQERLRTFAISSRIRMASSLAAPTKSSVPCFLCAHIMLLEAAITAPSPCSSKQAARCSAEAP
jgi:hypothetical protein